ncbi:hydrolase [Actinomadura rubrobrunea]|uniref:Hydrolase n=1 Tax=Actinomadura rubrobrunea TaxID=115335 RepID=A0A9W6USZ0_9ACTN|nr:alpha/beta hydrolase fold domain-containing protein [Actinomadura rubrobrunea]GLW62149.1 hydrolase [Actinomadura rubrobrunea]
MTTSISAETLRLVAATAAQRKVARTLAMEPGGPPTLRARIANQVIRAVLMTAWRCTPDSEAGMTRMQRATDLLGRLLAVPRGVSISPQDLGACTAEWVRAGTPDERRVILYLHGGAYFFGSPRLYRPFTWRLSAATGRPVLALDYRLAPRHTPGDALDDALTAYRFLLGSGYRAQDVVVGGDSAGGHLTLALLLALKEHGTSLPAAAVCLSPWVDLYCEADSHRLNRRTDCLLPADKLAWLGRLYCQEKEDDDPLFSPLRGDLSGLPPLMVMASGSEILRDDARDLAARARAAGVHAVHQEWDGMTHVFPVFAEFIPEGKAAFRHVAEFLRAVEA